MKQITRKSLLYKSGLGFWCINHVQGCSHGCRYPCYAWMMADSRRRVDSYEEWCRPALVSNAEELLEKELNRMRTRPDSIHLCLTTDPFMYGFPDVTALTLRLIELINSFGISCSTLTKGIMPVELADTSRFPEANTHGISLVSLDEDFRNRWEPGAAHYSERIGALRELHDYGCRTLVHIEPYPTPNIITQSLQKLLEAVAFADEIWLGGWNYNDLSKNYPGYKNFYEEQSAILNRFLAARQTS
ncbi:MAG TPA: radical SAM protein [Bacteroidales bacterium]|nr:radical SAM protein [Bacteroidales bacterium]